MFSLFKRRNDELVIDRDHVRCPIRQGDVGIDVCAACPWITEIRQDARPPFLRCAPANPGHPLHLWI